MTVGAARGVSAALDAGTGHGRVSNAPKNDGNAVLDIHATTSHGDVTARSLQGRSPPPRKEEVR